MSEDNPYAPPMADLTEVEDFARVNRLADRGTRFVASFVDGIIGMCYGFPIAYAIGYWKYALAQQQPPLPLLVAVVILSFACFLLVHGYLLKKNGQTIGKKLTHIRIADLEGNVPDFTKVILLRYLPLSIAALIPVVGQFYPLADVLFIFRQDRRCVHDLLASTQVLKAGKLTE